MAIPSQLRFISLGQASRHPREGRVCVAFTVDLTASPTYTQNIGGGTTQYSFPYMRSIWFNNNENPAGGATIIITIPLTGQVLTCLPGRSVYLPLFGGQPLQLNFTTSTGNTLTKKFSVITANFDFAATIAPLSRSASLVPSFADAETPGGVINGVNTVFTLANTPLPAASLELFTNSALGYQGIAYTLTGKTITFNAAYIPQIGDVLLAFYRF